MKSLWNELANSHFDVPPYVQVCVGSAIFLAEKSMQEDRSAFGL